MIPEEIPESGRSLPKYAVPVLALFMFALVQNVIGALEAGSRAGLICMWLLSLVVGPFLNAGACGALNEHRRDGRAPRLGDFFRNGCWLYLYYFVATVFFVLATLTFAILVFVAAGGGPMSVEGKVWLLTTRIPLQMVTLYWFAALAAEHGRIGRSLVRGFRTLMSDWWLLGVALAWAALSFSDAALATLLEEHSRTEDLMALAGVRAGVTALARVFVYACAIASYRKARVALFGEATEEPEEESPEAAREGGERLLRGCTCLVLVSFLPVLNLIGFAVGLLAIKRVGRFSIRALSACCLGGLSTAIYVLVAIGAALPHQPSAAPPKYLFLAKADPSLCEPVALLRSLRFAEARKKAEATEPDGERSWAHYCLLGIAKTELGEHEEAEADFERGLSLNPERGEYHYFFGLAQLKLEKFDYAAENFRKAANAAPKVEDAERLLALCLNACRPSKQITAIWFVVILLILFTFHEYAHAYSAWRLGDDTAKREGRITLNPIAHLDLFGSIILPGLLLFRESQVIFGWAKPVPVDPRNFKDPRKDHMVVSFAGPGVNIVIALVCVVVLATIGVGLRLLYPEAQGFNLASPFTAVSVSGPSNVVWLSGLIAFVKQLLYTSLVLGCFNLIPVPPLDGSWIVSGMLSDKGRETFEKARPFGFVIFLLIVMTPALGVLLSIPVGAAWLLLQLVFMAMGLGLA